MLLKQSLNRLASPFISTIYIFGYITRYFPIIFRGQLAPYTARRALVFGFSGEPRLALEWVAHKLSRYFGAKFVGQLYVLCPIIALCLNRDDIPRRWFDTIQCVALAAPLPAYASRGLDTPHATAQNTLAEVPPMQKETHWKRQPSVAINSRHIFPRDTSDARLPQCFRGVAYVPCGDALGAFGSVDVILDEPFVLALLDAFLSIDFSDAFAAIAAGRVCKALAWAAA